MGPTVVDYCDSYNLHFAYCWCVFHQRIILPPNRVHLAFSIIAIYSTVTSTTFGAVGVDYATALYSTSLVTTLFCTGAIVYRILQIGTQSKRGTRLHTYRSIIEILIESSALYCIATLFALVAYIRSGPASEYASAFWTSVTVSSLVINNIIC